MREVVVMARVLSTMLMESDAVTTCWGTLLSLNWAVKLVLPTAVGVPLMTPADESDKPAGNDDPLARLQVTGTVPPVYCRVAV